MWHVATGVTWPVCLSVRASAGHNRELYKSR